MSTSIHCILSFQEALAAAQRDARRAETACKRAAQEACELRMEVHPHTIPPPLPAACLQLVASPYFGVQAAQREAVWLQWAQSEKRQLPSVLDAILSHNGSENAPPKLRTTSDSQLVTKGGGVHSPAVVQPKGIVSSSFRQSSRKSSVQDIFSQRPREAAKRK